MSIIIIIKKIFIVLNFGHRVFYNKAITKRDKAFLKKIKKVLDNRTFVRYNENTGKNICSSGGNFMETRFVLTTLFEIAVIAFITYGLFNEAKFAETERKVFRFIKRYIRAFINGTDVSRERG